jgi:uncharacterized membrane protein YfcA
MVPLNTFVAWRERSHFDLRSVSWITTGRFAGTFVGFWILIAVTAPMLNLVVGATTVLAAVATKLAPKFTPSPTAYLGAGPITGVTETATGIGRGQGDQCGVTISTSPLRRNSRTVRNSSRPPCSRRCASQPG